MDTHYWAESTPLKPAGKDLTIGFIIGITTMETTDIGCPPCDACKSHVKTSSDLIAHRAEGSANIT